MNSPSADRIPGGLTALILAGGFATRLWPLTEKRAKPLLPLAGKPLIHHIIDGIPSGVRIIISTNRVFEADFLALRAHYPNKYIEIFIEDSQDDKNKKGALGATGMVIEHYRIDSPLLLIAGDNYFGFSLDDFLAAYDGKTLLASYDTKSLQAARQFGVVSVAGKKLVGFQEKPLDPSSTLVSTGCYLFAPQHLAFICEYARQSADNLGGIFEYLLQQKQDVEVFAFTEQWLDIGSFESYLAAHRLLSEQNRLAPDAKIVRSHLGNAVEIGAGCLVEDSELDEVILMEGCTVRHARLRGCIVDKNSTIESVDLDHKMIRAGTVIRGS